MRNASYVEWGRPPDVGCGKGYFVKAWLVAAEEAVGVPMKSVDEVTETWVEIEAPPLVAALPEVMRCSEG